MTPKDRAALEQMLLAIRDATNAAIVLLGDEPLLCPKCGSARWEEINTQSGERFGICGACGHEWKFDPDDIIQLQEVGD